MMLGRQSMARMVRICENQKVMNPTTDTKYIVYTAKLPMIHESALRMARHASTPCLWSMVLLLSWWNHRIADSKF